MAKRSFVWLRWGWRLLILALLAAGWTLAASAMHVVVVPAEAANAGGELKVLLVPKNRLSFTDTYADTRNWTLADVQAHEALVSRLVEAGRAEHLAHVVSAEQRRRLAELLRVRQGVLLDK